MVQEILALMTVFGAVAYLFWSIYKIIMASKKNENTLCSGCSSGGCSSKQLKNNVNTNN